jgi:hypothetical protein
MLASSRLDFLGDSFLFVVIALVQRLLDSAFLGCGGDRCNFFDKIISIIFIVIVLLFVVIIFIFVSCVRLDNR